MFFVIRKSVDENAVTTFLGWNPNEKLFIVARVVLELLKEQPITTPFQPPRVERLIKNLIFEYPVESEQENERTPRAILRREDIYQSIVWSLSFRIFCKLTSV